MKVGLAFLYVMLVLAAGIGFVGGFTVRTPSKDPQIVTERWTTAEVITVPLPCTHGASSTYFVNGKQGPVKTTGCIPRRH